MQVRIRTKLMALLVTACAVTLSAAVVTFVRQDTKASSTTKERGSQVLVQAVGEAVQGAVAFDDQASTEKVLQTFAAEPTTRYAVVYKADGAILGSWKRDPGVALPDRDSDAAGYLAAPVDLDGNGTVLRVRRVLVGEDKAALGVVVAEFATVDLQARTESIYRLSVAVLLGCILVALLLASRLHRVVTKPLQALAATATQVRESRDYSVRAQKLTSDEIQVVADAFNEMLVGIQARDTELSEHKQNLESTVEQRTRALHARNQSMRIVLDNVIQGIVTVDRTGRLDSERSASFDAWFGAPAAAARLDEHLATVDERCASWFRLGLDMVFEDVLPVSVALAQMPTSLSDGRRHFRIQYQPVFLEGREAEDSGAAVDKILVLFDDVTAAVEREHQEQGQREAFHVFQRMMVDRAGVVDFAEEAVALADRISQVDVPRDELLRAVHTLKGNAGLFDLPSIVSVCHTLESRMLEEDRLLSSDERAQVLQRVREVSQKVKDLMGQRKDVLDVTEADVQELRDAVVARAPSELLLGLITTWSWQPTRPRLERFAEQARALGRRLGRGDIEVMIEEGDVRLPAERYRSFFAALAHVVRNAVDHGLETPTERAASGKVEPARMHLAVRCLDSDVVVSISDNGRGIDWDRVREKCVAAGLPSQSLAELKDALFLDGLSTRSDVSETSGRGVGMSVVRAEVQALGGHIEIDSERGQGTTMRFYVPVAVVAASTTSGQRLGIAA